MIWFRTEWTQEVLKRKGPKAGQRVRERRAYETKTLTDLHAQLRAKHPKARTLKCDDSIKWIFGLWAEVVA